MTKATNQRSKWREVVVTKPGVCGGHPILKGRRVEVHNLVSDMDDWATSPELWLSTMECSEWMTVDELIVAMEFCAERECHQLGSFCCNCTLSEDVLPPSDPDHGSKTDGWRRADRVLVRLGVRSA